MGALLLLALLVLPQAALSSDGDEPAAAPTLTATSPSADAVGAPTDAAIEVWFSEPMNASTVAYEFLPSAPVTPTWNAAEDVLSLRPDPPGLAPCTVYRVRVDGEDADEALPLSAGPVPNPWSFMTACARPFLLATAPADREGNVPGNASIVVTFSEPMSPLTVALQLIPSPPSMITSWNGDNTVLTGEATVNLQPETTYLVTVTGSDTDGNPLAASLTPNPWSFTTNANPLISDVSVSPGGCRLAGSAVTLFWNVTDDVDIAADLEMTVSFLNGSTWESILGPATGFPSSVSYVWTLPSLDVMTPVRVEARDSAGGVAAAESAPVRIDSGPPRVRQTNPEDGAQDVPFFATIAIAFSEPMDRNSVEAALSVDPPLPGAQVQWTVLDDALLILPGGMRDRTTYRVTVASTAQDTCGAGRELIAPFTFSFATGAAPPASPAGVRVTEVGETSVTLSWDPVAEFITGTPIPSNATVVYHVFRGRNETDVGAVVAETGDTRWTDGGLNPSAQYVYRVVAVVDDVASAPSTSIAVRTRDPFLATQAGQLTVLLALAAVGAALLVWGRTQRTREPLEDDRLAAEVAGVVKLVRDTRTERDPERRRRMEEELHTRFRGLVRGAEAAPEGRPRTRLEGLYRALAQALVQSPEVDVGHGRRVVDGRLGRLSASLRRYGGAYRLLSEAEASVESELFLGLPESGRKALLLVYFYALEEYLSHRLRGLVPVGSTLLLGERGHLNVRRRGWESRWASLSLGDLMFAADRNRQFFVANEARWEADLLPLLREAVAARNRTAHPGEEPPSLDRVRTLVYDVFRASRGVFRRAPARMAA